ncbi:hypothetical protein VM1G_02412 [Cytospora mali]|uniref:Uncharacterized protein n=1 Tax=Cytospora mali TaxID=578113 RepID=A0A194VRL1_CYTMA|nr:hypothetical protein VM1G_02412 [Valsa mali]
MYSTLLDHSKQILLRPLKNGDILQRVAIQNQQIGYKPLLDLPQPVPLSEHPRRVDRRMPQHLCVIQHPGTQTELLELFHPKERQQIAP